MSNHTKVQDTFKRNIRCLNDQTKYEEWRAEILNYIMSRYPVAYTHIEYQVDPVHTFKVPILDQTIRIARKPITLADGFRFDNISAIDLPIVRTTDENFPAFIFDSQDVDFYYKYERNPQFSGNSGQKVWELQVSNVIRLKSKYLYEVKPQLWSDMEYYCSETILAKARIPKDVYDAKKLLFDYIWLFDKIKMVHTGECSASLSLKISELINIRRHKDLTIDSYNTMMVNAREDIMKMNVDPQNFMNNFFSVMYHIGLYQFALSNPTVLSKLEKIFEMHIWPSMDETMSSVMIATTVRQRIESDNTHDVTSQTQIAAHLAKQNRSSHYRTAFYKSLGIVDKGDKNKSAQCFNCCGDHRAGNCSKPRSKCMKCNEPGHCTQMHDLFMKFIARFNNNRMSVSKPSNNNKSLKSMFEEMENSNATDSPVDEEALMEDFLLIEKLAAFQHERQLNSLVTQK